MKLPRRFYTAGWLLIGVAMAALEATALVDPGTGDTLSEHLWGLLGMHPLIWWVSAGAGVWAIRHIFWKQR